MTEKEIREHANRVYLRSPINFHYRENLKRAFVDGATWINNLNQKEIEELKQKIAERKHELCSVCLNKRNLYHCRQCKTEPFKHWKVNSYEISNLRDCLADREKQIVERDKKIETLQNNYQRVLKDYYNVQIDKEKIKCCGNCAYHGGYYPDIPHKMCKTCANKSNWALEQNETGS